MSQISISEVNLTSVGGLGFVWSNIRKKNISREKNHKKKELDL